MNRTKTQEPIANQFVDEQMTSDGSLIQHSDYQSMDAERYFKASWGQQLKAITAGVSCLLIGISFYSLWQMLNGSAEISFLRVLLPLAIVALCSLFTVRGYTVSRSQLIIHRLGWSNIIELSGLSSATYVPGVMQGSFRTFAIGGLFSFAGNFLNSNLGAYRAYATNNLKSVVLKFAGNTIVVSPDEPEQFIAAVTSASKC